jgi:hypothetical protein
MRTSHRSLLKTALALLCAAGAYSQSVTPSHRIAVDFAPYRSFGEAAAAAPEETRLDVQTAVYAASELRHYLCKLSAVSPSDEREFRIARLESWSKSLALFVLLDAGRPSQRARAEAVLRRARLAGQLDAAESFALVPEGNRLFLIGRDRVGLLYSVYSFLESQGVRWYAPGPMGEFVPATRAITLPAGARIEKPRFRTRGFWAWEPRGHRDFRVWMARNRINFWTIAEPDPLFLRMLGIRLNSGGHWVFEKCVNPDSEYPYRVPGSSINPNAPSDPYPQSPKEFQGDRNGDGKLQYFEAHPEWYGLVGGERRTFRDIVGVNICNSNRSAMTELCRRIVNELAAGDWRYSDILDFWPLDVGKWCECESCRALGPPTDRLLLMVHQVRQALAEAATRRVLNRSVTIFFPIYAETLSAPTRSLPASFDYVNCIGTLFPIDRCYIHKLDDPDCRETNVPIWKTITGWRQGERFYKGDYVLGEYYNVSRTKSLPVLYTRVMPLDIRAYADWGVSHFHYMHVTTRLQGFKRLTDYLLGKLLWDPRVDVAALTAAYYRDFYGGEAEPVRELYGRLEVAMSAIHQWKSDRQGLVNRINNDRDPLFPLAHLPLRGSASTGSVPLETSVEELKACRRIMDGVLARTPSSVVRDRLLEDDRNLRYAENTVNLYDGVARALLARREGDLEAAKRYYARTLGPARELKAEVEIVRSSAAHANARDGLDASLIEAAWRRLGRSLGFPE